MARVVNENKHLYGTKSVADVVVINPNVSGMGVMASWGPWTSEEYRVNHTDIVRHLSSIGANFELLTEDTLSAEKLKPYRLVVVNSPALYPWVRKALAESKAHVLALCWAGTVVAPGPEDKTFHHAWKNGEATWWATQGTGVERVARVRFDDVGLAGGLKGKDLAYAQEKRPVSYVRGMKGTPIAKDDEGQTVFASTDWNGRRLYHFGIPLSQKNAGRVMTDLQFREILTAVLREAGCTAYGDLGPLRLYETDRWLLFENPNGTTGTVAEPRGDFEGTLPVRTKHPPMPEHLTADGQLKLKIPAGASVVIPLRP